MSVSKPVAGEVPMNLFHWVAELLSQLLVQVVCYHRWCTEAGPAVSNPTMSEVADYLLWLWESRKLSVFAVKGHRSILLEIFRFNLPELGDYHVLRDLVWSFAVELPHRPQLPPSWDLDVVLGHLMSATASACGP